MKKTNIIISGVMAVILSGGAASAAGIASQDYVDRMNTAQTNEINSSVDTKLTSYAKSADVYTKTQADAAFATQDDIDAAVNGVVGGELEGYVKTETYEAGLATKASTTSVGDITTLTTTAKTSTVAAINENVGKITAAQNAASDAATAAESAANAATAAQAAATAAQADAKSAQDEVDALGLVVNNETTGLVATKKIADAAAATAAEAKAGLDAKVDASELSGYVTTEAAQAFETTAHASATYADKTSLQTLDDEIHSETSGLVKTKQIADAAMLQANQNKTALENKLGESDLAAYDYISNTDAAAKFASKGQLDTLNATVTNAETGLVKLVADNTSAIAAADLLIAGKANTNDVYTKTSADEKFVKTADFGNLAELAASAPAECAKEGKTCALTFNGTTYVWEVIAR